MLSLERKVAVITGGTSGIGARTAEVFVAEGAKAVIAGRRKERGERLAQKLGDDRDTCDPRALLPLKFKESLADAD